MAEPETFVCWKEIDRSLVTFPQNGEGMAVIGNKVGVHVKGFAQDFTSIVSFSENYESNSSYTYLLITSDWLLRENFNSPGRMTKRNVNMLKSVITLYCPGEAAVFD